jgi:hypothetical protein
LPVSFLFSSSFSLLVQRKRSKRKDTLLFWFYLKSHHDWKSMNSLRSDSTDFLNVMILNQITNQNKRGRKLLRSKGKILNKAVQFNRDLHSQIDIYQAILSSQERDGLSVRKPG